MPYPYDSPAEILSEYWSDGAYTPPQTTAYIKDNFTPINKNSLTNSIGKQLSLIQNFVNTTYIGRPTEYIGNGYIDRLNVGSIVATDYEYISDQNITYGSLNLCSSIMPIIDNKVSIGSIGGAPGDSKRRLSKIVARTGYFTSLSVVKDQSNHPEEITMLCDLVPSISEQFNLGSPTKQFSNIYTDYLSTFEITSPEFTSYTYPGTTYLRCNLVPHYETTSNLGHWALPFNYTYTYRLVLFNPHQTYSQVEADTTVAEHAKEHILWVDVNGFVRCGNFAVE